MSALASFQTGLARPRHSTRVVCSAQPEKANKIGQMVGAALLAASLAGSPAYAEISGLTPCAESKAFQKREKTEVKNLTKRQKLYAEGSAPFVALQATIEKTEKRFDAYGKANLLCGSDGLPHLIADPGLALRYGHAGEMFLPTLGFLYVAGYIGHTGRKYLQTVSTRKNPQENEIIIDVPLATRLAATGFVWPIEVFGELRNGTLTEDNSKITVSPR